MLEALMRMSSLEQQQVLEDDNPARVDLTDSERKAVNDVGELVRRGALLACIHYLRSLGEQPSETLLILMAELYIKLMDLQPASAILDRVAHRSEASGLRARLSELQQIQATRGLALRNSLARLSFWDALVRSNLDTIRSIDTPSWRVLQSNLYTLAYQYMTAGQETCAFFYEKFQDEVREFASGHLLIKFASKRETCDIESLEGTICVAHKAHQHFCHRLVGIFQYLDRYHLRLRNLPRLEDVCRRAFLFDYFEKTILPSLIGVWILTFRQQPPPFLASIGKALIEYSIQTELAWETVQRKLFIKQRVLSIRGQVPSELLKHIYEFMA
jgi:hypothetical protein